MQTSVSTEQNENEEEHAHDTRQDTSEPAWSPRIVYIRAAVANLDSPLIPFAVLKDDPLLNFCATKKACCLHAQAEDAAEVIGEMWNQPFTELANSQLYFLIAWSAVPHASRRIAPLAELAFGIATPGLHYKRWITTCAVAYQGEPVAWCIEVDMLGAQEETIEIVLTEEHMIRLLHSEAERNSRVA